MQLYEKDGKYFLVLEPYTDKILSSNICISANNSSELESMIEDLSCNIGIMLAENTGKLQKVETEEQIVQIDGKEIGLTDFEHLRINGKGKNVELYRDEELTHKLKSLNSKLFGKDRNEAITSYINNSMFTRMMGTHTLGKEDFELLKYYKEEGYEFLNSFFRNGELKTRGNIEKEHIGKEFIDNLYRLYGLFEKLPTLEESITVYRGVASRDLSESINYDSFISTSLDKNFAKNNFAKGTLYEIDLPKGTHYIPIDAIEGFEGIYSESEAEILLRPSEFNVTDRKTEDNLQIVSMIAKEKDNFSEILLSALNRRKEDLIQKGLCSERDFEEILSYVEEKNREQQKARKLADAKENENRYKAYKMNIMRQVSDVRREIDFIREAEASSDIERTENGYKEAELIQKYNSLVNSAKQYDLTLREISLLEQFLTGKIDGLKRNQGLEEIKQNRDNQNTQGDLIYSRDEVERCQKAIDMYRLQGNQAKVDEYTIKLQSARKQYEFAKKETESIKNRSKQGNTQTNYTSGHSKEQESVPEQVSPEQVSTQKFGKETIDINSDVKKVDAVENEFKNQMKQQTQKKDKEGETEHTSSFRESIQVDISSNQHAQEILDKFRQDLENGTLEQEKKEDSHKVEKGDDDYIM